MAKNFKILKENKNFFTKDLEKYIYLNNKNHLINLNILNFTINTKLKFEDFSKTFSRILKSSSFKLNWILDPFMNDGNVGLVSKKSGRRFIGFESNQDKLLLAMKRINEGK